MARCKLHTADARHRRLSLFFRAKQLPHSYRRLARKPATAKPSLVTRGLETRRARRALTVPFHTLCPVGSAVHTRTNLLAIEDPERRDETLGRLGEMPPLHRHLLPRNHALFGTRRILPRPGDSGVRSRSRGDVARCHWSPRGAQESVHWDVVSRSIAWNGAGCRVTRKCMHAPGVGGAVAVASMHASFPAGGRLLNCRMIVPTNSVPGLQSGLVRLCGTCSGTSRTLCRAERP